MVWAGVASVYNISSFAYVKRLGMHIVHTIKHIHFYNSCGVYGSPFQCNLKDRGRRNAFLLYSSITITMCLFNEMCKMINLTQNITWIKV